jgi:hypothetical protein
MHLKTLTASVLAMAFATGTALANVPEDVAARLGQDLTPMGSERAGNAAGTIPEWTGGLDTIPANVSYDQSGPIPNPFPDDEALFTINASNMGQYSDNLLPGYQAMMERYPNTFHMDVYQTRRTCAYPDYVYEANARNARVSVLTPGGNGVSEGIMGAPFPILAAGLEAVWDHTLRYRSYALTRQFAAAPVTPGGDYSLLIVQDEALLMWSSPDAQRAEDLNNISIYYIANTIAPARAAGSVILVHEAMNATVQPRQAWQYSPGTRRVRRAPNISYDNPGTNSDGLSTSDSFDGYNGAPDRYDWRLVGKSEEYIAFNTYDAQNTTYEELIQPGHLNQDDVRYELHRVWTVEATLRPNTRHVYSRRVKHFDEDSNGLALSELYDSRGELWRVQELHTLQYYHVPLCGSGGEFVYDLQNGRYLALALRNEEPSVDYFAEELTPDRYTPAVIRRLGTR